MKKRKLRIEVCDCLMGLAIECAYILGATSFYELGFTKIIILMGIIVGCFITARVNV